MDELIEADREFLRVVAGRLASVRQKSIPGCADDEIRQASMELRELLPVEFHRAWRLLELEPKVAVIPSWKLASDFDSSIFAYVGGAVDTLHVPNLQDSLAQGFSFNFGMPAARVFAENEAGETIEQTGNVGFCYQISGDNVERYHQNDSGCQQHDFTVNDYGESVAIFVHGLKIKRRDVVAYVANTRGGNHWDPSGKKWGGHRRDVFVALEHLRETSVSGRDPAFYAVMSIAQDIVAAPDAARLEEAIAQALPINPHRR